MTRQEFIDEITTWDELVRFCSDSGCDACDYVYSQDSYDDYIDEWIVDVAREEMWQDLKNILNDLPDGYDYYERNDYDDWRGLDDYDDLDRYIEDALDWGDDTGYWEDEEEEELQEEESFEPYDPEDEVPVENEDVSFVELFSSCADVFQNVRKQIPDKELKDAQNVDEMTDDDEFDMDDFNNLVGEFLVISEGSWARGGV